MLTIGIQRGDPFASLEGLTESLAEVDTECEVSDHGPMFSWDGPPPAVEVVLIYLSVRAGIRIADALTDRAVDRVANAAAKWARWDWR